MKKQAGDTADLQENWRQFAELHRWEIYDLIHKALESVKEPVEAAVLGAGEWEDIDLVDLAAHASKVVYLDMGNTGSKPVVQGITGTLARKISLHTGVDFIGLDKLQFQERFQHLLENRAKADEVIQFLHEIAEKMEQAGNLSEPKELSQYAVVISLPVYTQLFYVDALLMLAPYMEQYGEKEIGDITRSLAAVRSRCVEAYNRLLFSLVKPGGRVAIWTEMIKVDEQTKAMMDQLYMDKTEQDRVRSLFIAFGRYGMDAAVSGLKHAFDRMNPEKTHFATWLWPLSDDRQYVAAGLVGEPRNV